MTKYMLTCGSQLATSGDKNHAIVQCHSLVLGAVAVLRRLRSWLSHVLSEATVVRAAGRIMELPPVSRHLPPELNPLFIYFAARTPLFFFHFHQIKFVSRFLSRTFPVRLIFRRNLSQKGMKQMVRVLMAELALIFSLFFSRVDCLAEVCLYYEVLC
jgi:hypothetical protein